MVALLWCLVGLAALVGGAELLVKEGTRLAALAGIPPILIGLTVVAIGTSMPELAVGIEAALQGNGSLAVGNIAGTNTFNILFILGMSAAIIPLSLQMRTIRFDLPVMAATAAALLIMVADGNLSRMEGAVLVAGAILYTGVIILGARKESKAIKAEFAVEFGDVQIQATADRTDLTVIRSAALLVAAIAIVLVGADWLVYGATHFARQMGVSDAFIGLTIVAIGTSAPELVTTLISTLKGERDIAIGNLLGSSIYNILLILGLTALFPDGGIDVERDLVLIDIPVTGAVALLCIPVFLTGRHVTRLEGALFVTAYIIYLAYLILSRG